MKRDKKLGTQKNIHFRKTETLGLAIKNGKMKNNQIIMSSFDNFRTLKRGQRLGNIGSFKTKPFTKLAQLFFMLTRNVNPNQAVCFHLLNVFHNRNEESKWSFQNHFLTSEIISKIHFRKYIIYGILKAI